ncbi:MAG: CDP-archaeol synthase [Leadbetterella sp.]
MNDPIYGHFLSVIVPLIITNVLHMLVVKYKIFSILTTPLHKGLFGTNKTYRGLLFIPVCNSLVTLLFSRENPSEHLLIGFTLGLAYALFELPNSFLKRRLGIRSGESSSRHKWLFWIFDKSDSAFGVILAYFLLFDCPVDMAIRLFMLSVIIHASLSFILLTIKIKKSF